MAGGKAAANPRFFDNQDQSGHLAGRVEIDGQYELDTQRPKLESDNGSQGIFLRFCSFPEVYNASLPLCVGEILARTHGK